MSGELNLGVNRKYAADIEFAATRTRLDPAVIAAVIEMEAQKDRNGVWDKDWSNHRSSAQGVAQMLSRTWIEQAQTPGRYLHDEARRRGLIGNDNHVVDRGKLLDLRFDARCAIVTAAEYAADGHSELVKKGVFRPDASPTQQARDLYLMHFLGADGATQYVQQKTSPSSAHRRLHENHQDLDKALAHHDGNLPAAWHDFVAKRLAQVDAEQFRAPQTMTQSLQPARAR